MEDGENQQLTNLYEIVSQEKNIDMDERSFSELIITNLKHNQSSGKMSNCNHLAVSIIDKIMSKSINIKCYIVYCKKLAEHDMTSILLRLMQNESNKFFVVCIRNCLLTILKSIFFVTHSFGLLKCLQERVTNTFLRNEIRTSIIEIFTMLLSRNVRTNNQNLHGHLVQMLQESWKDMVIFYIHKHNETERYSSEVELAAFLSLWKKLLKSLSKLSGSKCSFTEEFTDSLIMLFEAIENLPTHCICKTLDIFSKAIESRDNAILKLATKILVSLVEKKLRYLMMIKIKGGFLGSQDTSKNCLDARVCSKAVLFSLKLCCIAINSKKTGPDRCMSIEDIQLVCQCMHELQLQTGMPFTLKIQNLFMDQDDCLIEAMHCLLQISLKLSLYYDNESKEYLKENVKRLKTNQEEINSLCVTINPHLMFLHFLLKSNWDHSLILDFIISPETIFLEYFIQYLKYLVSNWNNLVVYCKIFSANGYLNRDSVNGLETNLGVNDKICDKYSLTNEFIFKDCVFENSNSVKCITDSISVVDPENKLSTLNKDSNEQLNTSDFQSHGETLTESDDDKIDKNICQTCCYKNSNQSEKEKNLDSACTPSNELQTSVRSKIEDSITQNLVQYSDSSDEDISHENAGYDEQQLCNSGEFLNYGKIDLYILDKLMSVIIRLRLKVDRMNSQNIFPFQAKPLIDLIKKCELLYET